MRCTLWICLFLVIATTTGYLFAQDVRKGEMAGYLLVPNEKVLETFNAGFSMYIAAWPLLKQYPGQRFQSGLPGTWMADVSFARKRNGPPKTYETPAAADSCWKKPGPKAGPIQAYPGDGSVVTYYWYRFADQPALLNADLSEAERDAMQQRVELLHRHWTKDRDYFAPPASGQLANLDPAVVVTPPPELEIGYVPIVTRQEPQSGEAKVQN
jgi:hypothetical protein